MYADDTNLLLADTNVNTLHSKAESELKLVNQWINDNKLKLNISKTNYIFFQNRSLKRNFPTLHLDGDSLTQVTHAKFLGILIDENLNWKIHIDELCKKISKMCGILYKIRYNLTPDALLSIYYTLCYSRLTYCVSIWANTWPSFLNKVTIAQNKVFRCIFFLGKFDSVTDVISSMKILKFENIFKYFTLLLIYKLLNHQNNNEIFKYVQNIRQTRSNNVDLFFPQFRTTLYKYSILCAGPALFNSLPLHIKTLVTTCNLQIFKRKIRSHLLQNI